jgi:hypothetical protein
MKIYVNKNIIDKNLDVSMLIQNLIEYIEKKTFNESIKKIK